MSFFILLPFYLLFFRAQRYGVFTEFLFQIIRREWTIREQLFFYVTFIAYFCAQKEKHGL